MRFPFHVGPTGAPGCGTYRMGFAEDCTCCGCSKPHLGVPCLLDDPGFGGRHLRRAGAAAQGCGGSCGGCGGGCGGARGGDCLRQQAVQVHLPRHYRMPVAPEFQQVSGDGRVLAWLADPWEAPYLNDFTSPMSLRMNDS